MDLEVNPKTMTSAINVALAQRLVRKLCPVCKKERMLTNDEKRYIDNTLGTISDQNSVTGVQKEKLWDAVGCIECNNSGYKGRIGIYEAILTDETLEKAVRGRASEREIKKETKAQGILSMEEDGIIKVLNGVTSIDELKRVIELGEEI